MHAAWERITKLQKINMIEAAQTSEPEKLRNGLLAELNPAAYVSPFKRIQAVAQPADPRPPLKLKAR